MKIYFVAAISQKPQFGKYYTQIVSILEKHGAVQHGHITDDDKTLQYVTERTEAEALEYYRQANRWISSADLVVVEASFPSTINIGHEITLAFDKGKPVIVLYKVGHDSIFLHGINSERLILAEYTEDTLEQVLSDSITFARDTADTRFNFFISPRHIAYLDWVAKVKKIPRSVYLRRLIEQDRERNESFQEANGSWA